jgi:hypothetical protein
LIDGRRPAIANDPRSVRRRRCAAVAVLGGIAVLAPGTLTARVGSTTVPGPLRPVDGTIVTLAPVYPPASAGFLRLPDTRSAPVRHEAPGRVWSPAQLEPVVGLSAEGRITSILEYTPGRFER